MTESTSPAQTTPTLRNASRVVVVDEHDCVLLFRAEGNFTFNGSSGQKLLWFTPGGGQEGDETPEETARRELWEETGLTGVELSPCVWVRHIVFTWSGVLIDSHESFFICRVPHFELDASNWTVEEQTDLADHRWWSLEDLEATDELYVPSRLPALLRPILRGELPDVPFEVGH
jgi:8-oxo-dGTP pyrophosphatase MutT (NUDIX family)